MNCRNCRCSTAWWLEFAASLTPLKNPATQPYAGFFRDLIWACSAGDGCSPLHVQAGLTCVGDQVIDAIHAKGCLPRQQGIPVLRRKVGLKPEHAVHAGGIHLYEALVEARSDEIQRLG